MPLETYKDKRFSASSLEIIAEANAIIQEYAGERIGLTLRQLYYQFVARGLIENNLRSYKRIGSIINDARLAGWIDWSAIEDRLRKLEALDHWDGPEDIIENVVNGYIIDKWQDQDFYVEVWIEKDALVGVIQSVCEDFDVPYFACRGNPSQSEMWRAGKRLSRQLNHGKDVRIIYLGDHDPTGIDITRDIEDRLGMFTAYLGVEVPRIALNMDQVEEYGPPPNPTKMTDSRAAGYVERFGHESWELDALDPRVIRDLIRDKIGEYRDEDRWQAMVVREETEREILTAVADRWEEVKDFLADE